MRDESPPVKAEAISAGIRQKFLPGVEAISRQNGAKLLPELIAAFWALSAEDQAAFRAAIKRQRGRPSGVTAKAERRRAARDHFLSLDGPVAERIRRTAEAFPDLKPTRVTAICMGRDRHLNDAPKNRDFSAD
jgi:hypothetical protein